VDAVTYLSFESQIQESFFRHRYRETLIPARNAQLSSTAKLKRKLPVDLAHSGLELVAGCCEHGN
jgi:hypothetical protein